MEKTNIDIQDLICVHCKHPKVKLYPSLKSECMIRDKVEVISKKQNYTHNFVMACINRDCWAAWGELKNWVRIGDKLNGKIDELPTGKMQNDYERN